MEDLFLSSEGNCDLSAPVLNNNITFRFIGILVQYHFKPYILHQHDILVDNYQLQYQPVKSNYQYSPYLNLFD